jgi:Asp-tRNA(Asn)/Glu-tRNA(Gln) amidotransferase B subunit
VVCRITNELLGQLTLRSLSFKENPIDAAQMGSFIDLLQQGNITGMYTAVQCNSAVLTLQ